MIDIASETWSEIKQRCRARIDLATGLLIKSGVDQRVADEARGEIAAYQDILALAEPLKVQLTGDAPKSKDRSGY
jgi:hypothetical protein